MPATTIHNLARKEPIRNAIARHTKPPTPSYFPCLQRKSTRLNNWDACSLTAIVTGQHSIPTYGRHNKGGLWWHECSQVRGFSAKLLCKFFFSVATRPGLLHLQCCTCWRASTTRWHVASVVKLHTAMPLDGIVHGGWTIPRPRVHPRPPSHNH